MSFLDSFLIICPVLVDFYHSEIEVPSKRKSKSEVDESYPKKRRKSEPDSESDIEDEICEICEYPPMNSNPLIQCECCGCCIHSHKVKKNGDSNGICKNCK